MRQRLSIVLSATALLVALVGATPLGNAAARLVADYAKNADRVDGIHASKTPRAGKLLPLNGQARVPNSVVTVESLDGARCNWNSRAGALYLALPVSDGGARSFGGTIITCVVADAFEQNDNSATSKNVVYPTDFDRAFATIYPAGDDDWFNATRTERYLKIFFDDVRPFSAVVRRDGLLISGEKVVAGGFRYLRFDAGVAGESAFWVIHVDGQLQPYQIKFDSLQ
jgi:hypothetical protein